MCETARIPFQFTLPADEAAVLDANISLMRYAFPDLSQEDALVAIVRRGNEDILKRCHAMLDKASVPK